MKRILILLTAWALLCALTPSAARAFSWHDVRDLHAAGISDSLILQKIAYSGHVFHLEANELRQLKEAGVSDEVISAMLETEARPNDDSRGPYYHPGYVVYPYPGYYPYSYYYPYYYYPRTRVSFNFGYRYGYGHARYYPHYGHYRPAYYPHGGYGGHWGRRR